jgi:hypothetical protein
MCQGVFTVSMVKDSVSIQPISSSFLIKLRNCIRPAP